MAKPNYRIPSSLNRSFLDHEITLAGGGWSLKPLPMKVLMFWGGSILVLFWVCTSTFVKAADWYLIALVVIWWLVATAFMGQYSKTKEMKFGMVPALAAFVAPSARRVITRTSADPSAFYSIALVDSIDDSGLIKWNDGTVGQAYLVVGSASILVFEADKKAMLDRVDSFWRKVETTAEFITITTKEPQRVWRQLGNLERQNRALQVRDPELLELMDEKRELLQQHVGKSFSSIHQYMVIKGDNLEALRRAHTVLAAEVEDSPLMIKACTMLEREDLEQMLGSIYQDQAQTKRKQMA